MDFPLPIRSVTTTVDYFTPLHVDTNIEYCMDMEKFPEINNTSHYCEPALVIEATNSYLPSGLCDMELTSFSDDGDISLDVTREELHELLETLDNKDFEFDDLGLLTHNITSWESADIFTLENSSDSQSTGNSQCQSQQSGGSSDNQICLNKKKRKRSEVDLSEDMPSLRRPKLDMNIATLVSFDIPIVRTLSRES